MTIKPQREPDSSLFRHSARELSSEPWMMSGVAPVAQRHQVRWLIRSSGGMRKKMMHIYFSSEARYSTLHALVIVALENSFAHPKPVR